MADAGFMGANTERLNQFGIDLVNLHAARIADVIREVDPIVGNLDEIWRGVDATRFKGEWDGHRTALEAAQRALVDAAGAATRNAQAQITNSEAY